MVEDEEEQEEDNIREMTQQSFDTEMEAYLIVSILKEEAAQLHKNLAQNG